MTPTAGRSSRNRMPTPRMRRPASAPSAARWSSVSTKHRCASESPAPSAARMPATGWTAPRASRGSSMAAVPSDLSRPTSSADGSAEGALRTVAIAGYALAALAVVVGYWLTRGRELFDTQDGFGYWLGIIGASLMATLLLYPLRKRLRFMHALGATRHWFRMHMIFGVLGPVLILYHCNFSFGSLNDTVALACTLLVAISGLVGRYVYAKVHVDLDGHRATLGQLSAKARITVADRTHAAALVPQLLERLTAYDAIVLTPPKSTIASLLLPLKLAIKTRWTAARLIWY